MATLEDALQRHLRVRNPRVCRIVVTRTDMKRPIAFTAVLVLSVAGCSSDQADFETYADAAGSVMIVSDCPNTDQLLSGNPDGLPHVSSTQSRDEIEAWLGDGGNSMVVPRNGEVWDRTADGNVVVTQVADYMIEVTIEKLSDCPGMPSSVNGIPIIYRIAGD